MKRPKEPPCTAHAQDTVRYGVSRIHRDPNARISRCPFVDRSSTRFQGDL